MLFGLVMLGAMTVAAYRNAPPIPSKIVDVQGNTLYTAADVSAGQGVFPHQQFSARPAGRQYADHQRLVCIIFGSILPGIGAFKGWQGVRATALETVADRQRNDARIR